MDGCMQTQLASDSHGLGTFHYSQVINRQELAKFIVQDE